MGQLQDRRVCSGHIDSSHELSSPSIRRMVTVLVGSWTEHSFSGKAGPSGLATTVSI